MKKFYILLAGILMTGLLLSGCKKKADPVPSAPAEATPTPAATATPVPEKKDEGEGDLVDMQASAEKEENVIGTKSTSAQKAEMVNETGAEIGEIYVRPHDSGFDDDEWGEELVNGSFTLKNSEKAVYYFERGSGDDDGLYDLRISFVEKGRSEYFFRKIPLDLISRISFCVDESEGVVIPYAKYLTAGGGTREISTLEEVKKRLGYYGGNEDEEENEEEAEPAPEPEVQEGPTSTPEPTEAPENPYDDPDAPQDPAAEAENYIGRPLQDLIDAFGEPSGNDYQDEPETGETGYHYYNTFTVSTTVDADGNEVVAGVW